MGTLFKSVNAQEEAKDILLNADAVILYRSSPSQKAELVHLMRSIARKKKICTVGDGANDVMML
jgi:P-type E1-E2 ATPase